MRRLLLIAVLAASPAVAQDTQTLADIRQDLSVLSVEMKKLQRELSTTGGTSVNLQGTSVLQRVDSMEAQIARLTARTEAMEHRIDSIVRDGTQRIGDLEFRLTEAVGGDLSKLGETAPLGGQAATSGAPAPAPQVESSDGPQLAVGEREDFRRAQEALASSDFQRAADLLATYGETYPGGPLVAEALVMRGKALEGLGDTREAARSYLQSYSDFPESQIAPDAVQLLGAALGKLGQIEAACQTLAQVAIKYPGAAAITSAEGEMARLGCN